MKNFIFILIVLLCPLGIYAQDLPVSGYTRATGFAGIISDNDPTLKSLYGETSLKLKAKAGTRGMAYTDIRFRAGSEYGSTFREINLREAYVDLYLGKVDFRVGKQISPWGRADGWNPTDNLTPADYFVRSPDPDDMRTGSFRVRGQFNPVTWLKLEADLVPLYTPSVYRFDQVDMPAFVTISQPADPAFQWDKMSVAGKLDLIFQSVEGSVSWFRGYDLLPGLRPGSLTMPPLGDLAVNLLQTPFRQQTLGADFATVILGTGIRGEAALKIPETGDSLDPFLPKSDIQWVVSLDREFGPFRLIAGYQGRFVRDFTPADPPQDFDPAILSNPEIWPMLAPMFAAQVSYYNRILYDQTHEWTHSLLVRPSLTLFRESLELEITGLYNFTTGEYLLYPKISWHAADGLLATAGYQYYEGDPYTRFSWIKNSFNGPFLEFRLTF